jgi:hypothetical protein
LKLAGCGIATEATVTQLIFLPQAVTILLTQLGYDYWNLSKQGKKIMNIPRFLYVRRPLAAAVLAVGLLATPMAASGAFAHLSVCRHDPVVFLSNGNMLDLTATIGDDEQNIQQIVYTIHIPRGTSVTGVQYTHGFNSVERLVAYSNDPAGTYDTYTDVRTSDKGVSVAATGLAVYKSGTQSQMASASGWANKSIHLHFFA